MLQKCNKLIAAMMQKRGNVITVQLPTSAVNVILLAFAAERRAAAPLLLSACGRAAIDLLPAGHTAANPQQQCAAGK